MCTKHHYFNAVVMTEGGFLFMKGFLSSFKDSAKEFTKIRSLTVTAIFIAVSMLIEGFSIDLQFAKLNFAFIAIAIIGMLFGPCVGFVSGLACDIVGYLVHPAGAFLPIYVLVAGLQGFIYGICLYHRMDGHGIQFVNNRTGKSKDITLFLRIIVARILDVIIINLLLNTALNLHYGFIPQEAYGAAIVTRTAKNVIELVIDLPLLFILLPIALTAYQRVFHMKKVNAAGA